jgi:type II secretory pathway pseudopilin PulG
MDPQAARATTHRDDRGFVMVALLISMSVAAIWMAAALPAWRQQAQRDREDDLIFRGEQYARAIVLFQDKNRGALPPSIDILVSGHYLRKKWKDPVTGQDFIPIGTGIATPGGSSQLPGSTQQPGPGRAGQTQTPPGRGGQTPLGGAAPGTGQGPVGITGVRSNSTATSIKIYQNQQQYSMWPFDAALIRARMGRALPQQQGNPQNPRGGPGGIDRGGGTPGRGGGAPGGGIPGRPGPGGPGGGPPPPPPPGGRAGGS